MCSSVIWNGIHEDPRQRWSDVRHLMAPTVGVARRLTSDNILTRRQRESSYGGGEEAESLHPEVADGMESDDSYTPSERRDASHSGQIASELTSITLTRVLQLGHEFEETCVSGGRISHRP